MSDFVSEIVLTSVEMAVSALSIKYTIQRNANSRILTHCRDEIQFIIRKHFNSTYSSAIPYEKTYDKIIDELRKVASELLRNAAYHDEVCSYTWIENAAYTMVCGYEFIAPRTKDVSINKARCAWEAAKIYEQALNRINRHKFDFSIESEEIYRYQFIQWIKNAVESCNRYATSKYKNADPARQQGISDLLQKSNQTVLLELLLHGPSSERTGKSPKKQTSKTRSIQPKELTPIPDEPVSKQSAISRPKPAIDVGEYTPLPPDNSETKPQTPPAKSHADGEDSPKPTDSWYGEDTPFPPNLTNIWKDQYEPDYDLDHSYHAEKAQIYEEHGQWRLAVMALSNAIRLCPQYSYRIRRLRLWAENDAENSQTWSIVQKELNYLERHYGRDRHVIVKLNELRLMFMKGGYSEL